MEIQVKKISYPVEVDIVDGVPHCRCCAEPMAEVEPGQWMCALGVAILAALSGAARRLDEFVLG